jgi:hypothetical protein
MVLVRHSGLSLRLLYRQPLRLLWSQPLPLRLLGCLFGSLYLSLRKPGFQSSLPRCISLLLHQLSLCSRRRRLLVYLN